MTRKRGRRVPKFVEIQPRDDSYLYYFLSGLDSVFFNNLGQQDPSSTPNITKAVFKPNNLKPARANKYISEAKGYESSFCSQANIPTLKDDGWRTTRARYSPLALSGTGKSILCYALINGIKVGYRLTEDEADLPPNFFTVTGLRVATGDDEVIIGSAFPTLAQVKYFNPTTGKSQSYCADPSVFDTIGNNQNWSGAERGLTSAGDLKALLGV